MKIWKWKSFVEGFNWGIAGQVLASLALIIPLATYAWVGTFMRYSGDDYCYGSLYKTHGLWGAQPFSYLTTQTLTGNRYTLTLISNLSDSLGSVSTSIMPFLVILLWCIGLWVLLMEIWKILNIKTGRLLTLLLSEFIVFISLYQAPTIEQNLIWRSTTLTYTAPLICLIWLLYLIVSTVNKNATRPVCLAGIGLFSFFAAGFSETGAVFQMMVLLMGILLILLLVHAEYRSRKRFLIVLGVAASFTAIALLALALSPAIAISKNAYPHPYLISFVFLSFKHGLTFIYESLKALPLPSFVTLAFGTSFGIEVLGQIPNRNIQPRKFLVAVTLIGVVFYILCAASSSPSVLARSTYPEQRAWLEGRFVMVAALACFGFVTGGLLRYFIKQRVRLLMIFALFTILMTCLYSLRTVPRIISYFEPIRSWSAGWDIRDKSIRSAIASGEKDLHVFSLPMIIPYVSELKPNPGNWYNECAAGWYGVDTISADLSQP